MLNASIRRKTLLLLLIAVLATPWTSAAGLGSESPREVRPTVSPDAFEQAWNLYHRTWSKVGCIIDPDGRLCRSSPPESKIGCHIDPDGHVRCTP